MSTVKQAGGDSVIFTRPVGSTSAADWKMVSCQTGYSLSSSNSPIEVKTKCGTDYLSGENMDEAKLDGVVIKKSSDPKILDTVAIRELYESKVSQQFCLMPKVASAASNDMVMHTFTGLITNFDESFPESGVATFSMSIKISGGVTSGYFTYTP